MRTETKIQEIGRAFICLAFLMLTPLVWVVCKLITKQPKPASDRIIIKQ